MARCGDQGLLALAVMAGIRLALLVSRPSPGPFIYDLK